MALQSKKNYWNRNKTYPKSKSINQGKELGKLKKNFTVLTTIAKEYIKAVSL
jgi:hypothetical protein